MRIELDWVKEFTEIAPIDELTDKIARTGTAVEGVYKYGVNNVVVGYIEKILPHPNADALRICMVDIGEAEPSQIITRATNVMEHDVIPVALPGAVLADGLKIKAGKLRGEVSNGMMCSFEELGFTVRLISDKNKDGIQILGEEFRQFVGKDINEVLKLSPEVVEFEIMPNRPDCLSVYGMSREFAATFDTEIKSDLLKSTSKFNDELNIEITGKPTVTADSNVCNRYVLLSAEGVKIENSPIWMQVRLMKSGIKPINNVVDITNYILLETGQPLHAFDASKIEGNLHVVKSDQITKEMLLDGSEYEVPKDTILIRDNQKTVALAGLMGSENSKITDDTSAVLLEIANFDGDLIRQTSKLMSLRTDASARFEKGVSQSVINSAVARAKELFKSILNVELKVAVNAVNKRNDLVKVPFDVNSINRKIGITLTGDEIVNLLAKLDISCENSVAVIPAHRLDLHTEIDLVEEVARLYGMDNLPNTLPKLEKRPELNQKFANISTLKNRLVALGNSEIITYSFMSMTALEKVHDTTPKMVLKNPLGEEFATMRTSLVPNMLEVIKRNINRKNTELRLFELGTLFTENKENTGLIISHTGKGEDFFTLKGTVEELFANADIQLRFVKQRENQLYHIGRCADIYIEDKGELVKFGVMGEIHPNVLRDFEVEGKVYIAELDLTEIVQKQTFAKKFAPIPQIPAVERDLALVCDKAVENGTILDVIKKNAGKYLESVELFDVYTGEQIEKTKKSMAYSLFFRGEENLSDEVVDKAISQILKALREIGAELREK